MSFGVYLQSKEQCVTHIFKVARHNVLELEGIDFERRWPASYIPCKTYLALNKNRSYLSFAKLALEIILLDCAEVFIIEIFCPNL